MKFTSHLVPALLASFVSVPAAVSASHHLHPKVYPPGPLKVDKRAPQITQLAHLARRDTQQTCGVSYSLCPSSMDGGCCPDNYECGTASCTASSSKPGTCQGKTSFYACAQDLGGGCCPDGYMCNRSNGCVPPSGMPYTYSCPASHYMCPASLSFGCCPNGMGCATYQCYSTEATTQTVEMTVTTTKDGTTKTITTEGVTVIEASSPSTAPTIHAGDPDADQHVLKFFPSVVPKTSSSAVSSSDDGSSSSSIPTGTLVGIVVGALAFLVLVIAGAIILIKYMNRLARNVVSPHGSNGSGRPNMGQYRPTPTEVDAMSEDPFLMKSPGQVHARSASADSDSPYGPASPDLTSTLSVTPSSFAGYRPVSPGPSTDGQVNTFSSYFEPLPSLFPSSRKTAATTKLRSSGLSSSTTTDGGKRTSHGGGWSGPFHTMHSRNWSNDSDQRSETTVTSTPSELEAKKYVAELPNKAVARTRDEIRRLSNNADNVPELVKKEASRRRRATEARISAAQEGRMSPNGGLSPELNLGLGVVSEENSGESRPAHKPR